VYGQESGGVTRGAAGTSDTSDGKEGLAMQLRRRSSGVGPQPARTLDAKALTPARILALAVAGISPAGAVFTTYGPGLTLSGTGVIWAFVLGSVIAVAMALCFAEAGSVYPAAGGSFTIIHRALGPVFGGIASVLFFVLNIFFIAFVCVAMAGFISSLVAGGVPIKLTALGLLVAVALLTLGRVAPASWVASLMLILELAIILTFTGFAFAHPTLHANPFTHPQLFAGPHTVLAFSVGALFAGAAPALLALNGYDAPLYMVEETERRRAVPTAVLLAVGLAIVIQVTAVIAATYALPPNPSSVQESSAPVSTIATAVMGHTGSTVLTYGVIIAIFDSTLVGFIVVCRLVFDAARRSLWPGRAANRLLAYIGPTQVPVGACLVFFVGAGALALFSNITTLITFTTVILVVIYGLVAIAAIVTRLRTRKAPAGTFRMPLWPVPPIVAIGGAILVLKYQTWRDLLIAGCIVAVAAAYHLWRHMSHQPQLDSAIAGAAQVGLVRADEVTPPGE
jgi:amino acid transporter